MGDRIHMLLSGDNKYLYQSFKLGTEIFMKQAGWILIVMLPLMYYFKPTKSNVFLSFLVFSIVSTSYLNPFLFGATRIDHARTTTQMTLIIFLFISFIYYFSNTKKASSIVLLLLIPTSIMFYNYLEVKPYYLGWETKNFNATRNKLIHISKENNISRPTISNPDLGVMTWYKELNDIDLGMLGSPIMAKLDNGPMMTEYYLHYGLPDLIEAHAGWINRYCNSIFTKDGFTNLYSQIGSQYDMKQVCSQQPIRQTVYWIRKDIEKGSQSKERILLNSLQQQLSIERIKSEIDSCKASNDNCKYIARTVYKFIPELREIEQFELVYNLFDIETDKALLRGWRDGQAHQVIVDTVQNKIYHIPEKEPDVEADWDIYLEDNTLTYVKYPCDTKDTQYKFYLHVYPENQNDIPKGKHFKNMDFHFKGLIKDNTCINFATLPNFDIKAIKTGQYSIIYENKKRIFINEWDSYIDVK